MDSVGRTIPSKWQWYVPNGLVLVEMCDGGMVCPTLLGDGDGDNDGDDNGDGDDDPKPNMIVIGDKARACEDSGMQVERRT